MTLQRNLAELEHACLRRKLVAPHIAEASSGHVTDRRTVLVAKRLGRVGGLPADEDCDTARRRSITGRLCVQPTANGHLRTVTRQDSVNLSPVKCSSTPSAGG